MRPWSRQITPPMMPGTMPPARSMPAAPRFLLAALLAATLATGRAAAAPPRIETAAPVAYLVDLSSGATLFAREPGKRIQPASMTKMMTAFVILDMAERGELSLDHEISVPPSVWRRWHGKGTTMLLRENERITIRALLAGLLAVSANDAAYTLASAAGGAADFVARMNATAQALGMAGTHFASPSGLPDGGATYTSAEDLSRLARATITRFPDAYRSLYAQPGLVRGGRRLVNHNPLLGHVAGADGLKTGFHRGAGHCLTGSAIRDGRRLLLVVAGLHGEAARAQESTKLLEWGFAEWRAVPVARAGAAMGSMRVRGGTAPEVALLVPADILVTVPAASAADVVKKLRPLPVEAPVRAGQHVADLIVTAPDTPPRQFPLVAAAEVPRAGPLIRLWNELRDAAR